MDGKHYIYTSGTTSYTPNPSEVAVFDDYHGEYTVLGNPHIGDEYVTFFLLADYKCDKDSGKGSLCGYGRSLATAY